MSRDSSHLSVLRESTRLANRILREGVDTNPCSDLDSLNFWAFTLFARVIHTAESAYLLLENCRNIDAKLLARSICEGLVDLAYIKRGPLSVGNLTEKFRVERLYDWYEELEWKAEHLKTSIGELANENPCDESLLAAYMELKKQNRGQDPEHKRWRHIGVEEKVAALDLGGSLRGSLDLLKYPIRSMGNAVAHSRPIVLRQFISDSHTNPLTITAKSRPRDDSSRMSPSFVAMETAVCVLMTAQLIVEEYRLQDMHLESIRGLVQNLREAET